nr:DUF6090 family protein [uncultured Mucilaginibacter sp.]
MEHEIKDHIVKAYKVVKNPKLGLWHKFKEILVEIAIIVFAVTLSIWFHGISEHSHQQDDVKVFLLGLKADLQGDIAEMKLDKQSYVDQSKALGWIKSAKNTNPANADSLQKYRNFIFNTTGLIQNNGRYEGFKSSGKLGNIENDSLQNAIVDLYQENIPSLIASTSLFTKRKELLFEYINKNRKLNAEGGDNLAAVLLNDEPRNICLALWNTNEILDRYDAVIKKSEDIIRQIDEEYK